MESVQSLLRAHGLKASSQRVAILEYLQQVETHPTAEHLYDALKPKLDTLSLGTVYNTLNTLTACGLVLELTIHKQESRYDGNLENHGHFSCTSCGKLFDIPMNLHAHTVPEGFLVDSCQHFFYGLCPSCKE